MAKIGQPPAINNDQFITQSVHFKYNKMSCLSGLAQQSHHADIVLLLFA